MVCVHCVEATSHFVGRTCTFSKFCHCLSLFWHGDRNSRLYWWWWWQWWIAWQGWQWCQWWWDPWPRWDWYGQKNFLLLNHCCFSLPKIQNTMFSKASADIVLQIVCFISAQPQWMFVFSPFFWWLCCAFCEGCCCGFVPSSILVQVKYKFYQQQNICSKISFLLLLLVRTQLSFWAGKVVSLN